MTRPSSDTAAALGTTADCPRSSMRLDTRGVTTKMDSAISDEASPAVKNEYPDRVSMVTTPMFSMAPKKRMSRQAMSKA